MKTHCPDPKGNQICTNGKDTYHNYNMYHFGSCYFCTPVTCPTEPVTPNSQLISKQIEEIIESTVEDILLQIENEIEESKNKFYDEVGCTDKSTDRWCCTKHRDFTQGLQVALEIIRKYK